MTLRVGIGTDAHRKIGGRPLVLGGVEIPCAFGLEAHSDGDVLCHAVMDAILGAANLGDKGTHFPPTDPKYKDIRSTLLLENAMQTLRESGCSLVNVDISVVCEEPKIAPYVEAMKNQLAAALHVSVNRISIKGTTTEKMGFTGRGEGIAAMATALVNSPDCNDD
jgi:2-C-methyl-D-erythritol 2,4-cyclodiphosphate synthase